MEYYSAIERDKLLIHANKWMKSKRSQLYDSIYIKGQKRQIRRDRKQVSGCLGVASERKTDWRPEKVTGIFLE